MNTLRIVIIGATSAMAEHCARLWVTGASVDLTLVGRNISGLERIASDLRVRSPQSEIRVLVADFMDTQSIEKTASECAAKGPLDIVLIAHGSLPEQALCQNALSVCREALEINGLSAVLFAEAFIKHLVLANHGTLAIVGSVAGERGRKSNYVYGAAKAMVTRYAQGLQHRLASTQVKVVLIKPGPTDTPMTAHLKRDGAKLASVESVSRLIVQAIACNKPVVYVPAKWQLVMMIIRHLPNFIFNKMNI